VPAGCNCEARTGMEAPVPSRKKGYNKPFDLTNVATLNKELANMQRSA